MKSLFDECFLKSPETPDTTDSTQPETPPLDSKFTTIVIIIVIIGIIIVVIAVIYCLAIRRRRNQLNKSSGTTLKSIKNKIIAETNGICLITASMEGSDETTTKTLSQYSVSHKKSGIKT